MLFPQFLIYTTKQSLNYVDISNILLLTVNMKNTWNNDSFKKATHQTWMTFKDKLSFEQQIVLREAIISLRLSLYKHLMEQNYYWLSSSIFSSIYNFSISQYVLSFNLRKKTIKSFTLNTPIHSFNS